MAKVVLLFLGLLLLQPQILVAQGEDVSEEAFFKLEDQVVISGSKREQKTSEIPLPIYVITEEDIKRSNAVSVADLLENVPGLYLMRMNRSQYEIGMRGGVNIPYGKSLSNLTTTNISWGGSMKTILSTQMLVLIDGRSVFNTAFGGVVWETLNITLGEIKRIEIARGPATVLFGTNAFSGVINIITKNPKNSQGGSARLISGYPFAGSLQASYYGAFKKFYYGVAASGKYKTKFDYNEYLSPKTGLRGYRAESSDHRDGGQSMNVRVHGTYEFTDDMKAKLEYGFANVFFLLQGSTANLLKNLFRTNEQYVKADYQFDPDTTAKFYWKNMRFSGEGLSTHTHKATEYFAEAQRTFHLWESDWGSDDLLIGYNYAFYGYDSYIVYGKNYSYYHAGYFQNQLRLFDKKFLILLGGRFDYLYPKNKGYYNNQHALMYNFTDNRSVRFVFSQALRTPMMIDNFYDEIDPSNVGEFEAGGAVNNYDNEVWVLGRSDLNPVKIHNFELGFRDSLFDNTFKFDLSLFYYTSDDYIIVNIEEIKSPATSDIGPFSTKASFKNYGKISAYGGELDTKWLATKTTKIFGNYSVIYVKDHEVNKYLKNVPNHIIDVGVTQKFFKNLTVDFWLNMRTKMEVNHNLMDGNFFNFSIPATIVPNLRVSYSLFGGDLLAVVSAKNMFNKKMRYHPAGSNIGGLYLASLTYKF